MWIIVGIIVLAIYAKIPIIGKIIMLIINSYFHDPIPYVDEIIMWAGLFQNITRTNDIIDWITLHKKLSVFLAIVLIIVLVIILTAVVSFILN